MTAIIGGMSGTLGEQITARRTLLGLSGSAAAREAGVHRLTWRAWERDQSVPEEHNFVRIEKALGWTTGSVRAVLSGEEPTLEDQPTADPEHGSDEDWAAEVGRHWRRIRDERGAAAANAFLNAVLSEDTESDATDGGSGKLPRSS